MKRVMMLVVFMVVVSMNPVVFAKDCKVVTYTNQYGDVVYRDNSCLKWIFITEVPGGFTTPVPRHAKETIDKLFKKLKENYVLTKKVEIVTDKDKSKDKKQGSISEKNKEKRKRKVDYIMKKLYEDVVAKSIIKKIGNSDLRLLIGLVVRYSKNYDKGKRK